MSIISAVRAVAAPLLLAGFLTLAGCKQPTMFANPDPNLRKSIPELKQDAATRFPYKADAPQAFEPKARALVGYDLRRIEVLNFSGEDWADVEVWVNRQYVCHVPVMENGKLKEIHYAMLRDERGQGMPFRKTLVKSVELYRDGTRYEITARPVDY